MQITVDLIDWDWAKTAPDAQFFLEVMLDQDDADLWFGTSCYQFRGGWGDSALLYLEVCDAFYLVVEKVSQSDQGRLLEQGLSGLLSLDHKVDELGLQAFPEEGYIASISPQTTNKMAKACGGLKLDQLAMAFDSYIPPDRFKREDRLKMLHAYLEQWVIAVQRATKEKKGLLLHLG